MLKLFLFISLLLSFSMGYRGFSHDYYLEVARGNMSGISHINKFGNNGASTTGEDVWAGGGTYAFYPTVAKSMDVVSTASDTIGGTGCLTAIFYGLDSNWLDQNETVTLTGVTPANLTNKYIRMHRGICLTVGSNGTNIGDISVEIQGTDTSAVFISAGDGQSQQAIYTIPAGKSGYFIKGYVAISDPDKNGESAVFQWLARPNNGVNGAWQVKGEMSVLNIGSGWWQYEYGVPAGPLPEKTDIRIKVKSATAEVGTVGGFDFVLIDQ
jgi:hypothetical protein